MTGNRIPGMAFGRLDDASLEAALADLAGAVFVPPAPDFAAAVGRRLRELEAPPRRLLPRLPVRWALVAALIAVLLVAGAAVGFGFRLPGLEIIFVGPSSPPTPAVTATPATTPTVTGAPGPAWPVPNTTYRSAGSAAASRE